MRRSTSHDFQTGAGRPVNPEWANEFVTTFKQAAPAYARLKMRKIPGATYVSGPEFSRRTRKYSPGEPDERLLAGRIEEVIGNLCWRGVLDETTAREGLAPAHRARFELKPQNGAQKLSAVFTDTECDAYPSGYVYEGERPIVRAAFGIPEEWDKNRTTKIPPLVHVGICIIENLPKQAIQEVLTDPCGHLKSTLELMPVGVVRLEF